MHPAYVCFATAGNWHGRLIANHQVSRACINRLNVIKLLSAARADVVMIAQGALCKQPSLNRDSTFASLLGRNSLRRRCILAARHTESGKA